MKQIFFLVFLSVLVCCISANSVESKTYCLEHYDYLPVLWPQCHVGLSDTAPGYTCVAQAFPEDLKSQACPDGSGAFPSIHEYDCFGGSNDCLPGYEHPQQGDTFSNGPRHCRVVGITEASDFTTNSAVPCGDSGATLIAWTGTGLYPDYCCLYENAPTVDTSIPIQHENVNKEEVKKVIAERTVEGPKDNVPKENVLKDNRAHGNDKISLYAVGGNGTIMHYDGTSWKKMNSGTNVLLNSVWGSSDNNVYAVGNSGTVLQYDGRIWTKVKDIEYVHWWSGSPQDLNSVWGTSKDNVYIAGRGGTILHFNGERWDMIDLGDGVAYNSIGGMDDRNIYAVGEYSRLEYYNGSNWTKIRLKEALEANYTEVLDNVLGVDGDVILTSGIYSTWPNVSGSIVECKEKNYVTIRSFNKTLSSLWAKSLDDMYYVESYMTATSIYSTLFHDDGTSVVELFGNDSVTVNAIWGTQNDVIFMQAYDHNKNTSEIIRLDGHNVTVWPMSYGIASFWGTTQTSADSNKEHGVFSWFTGVIKSIFGIFSRENSVKVNNTIEITANGTGADTEIHSNNPSLTSISVPATDTMVNPLDTGIELKRGDTISFKVDRDQKWSLGPENRTCDANGLKAGNPYGGVYDPLIDPNPKNASMASAYWYGTLVGKIGDGNYFPIGNGISMQIFDDHGKLYLLCWDDFPSDNTGQITVSVKKS